MQQIIFIKELQARLSTLLAIYKALAWDIFSIMELSSPVKKKINFQQTYNFIKLVSYSTDFMIH